MRIALMAMVAALSTPAFAQDASPKAPTVDAPAAQSASQTPKSEDLAERKICKRIESSESRLAAQRVCLTQEQWKQREQESSDL